MNTTQALLVVVLAGGLVYSMTRRGPGALAPASPAPQLVPATAGMTPAQQLKAAQEAEAKAARQTKASAALMGIGGAIAAIGSAVGTRSDGADGSPAARMLGGLF